MLEEEEKEWEQEGQRRRRDGGWRRRGGPHRQLSGVPLGWSTAWGRPNDCVGGEGQQRFLLQGQLLGAGGVLPLGTTPSLPHSHLLFSWPRISHLSLTREHEGTPQAP